MKILALDPAAKTGWAIASTRDRIDASGVWDLGSGDARLAHIDHLLSKAINRWRVQLLAVEVATFGSRHSHVQRMHNELLGAIKLVAIRERIELWQFGIGTWKARAVGKGDADKAGVMRGLRVFYGIEVTDENQADAIGIALAAQMGPPPEPAKKVRSRLRKAATREPRLFR
jgi:Holliday junction resolvasome RuvABC endonuclease subunit